MFVKMQQGYLNLAEIALFVPGEGIVLRNGKALEVESAEEQKALEIAITLYGCADLDFIRSNYPDFRATVARMDLERLAQMRQQNEQFTSFLRGDNRPLSERAAPPQAPPSPQPTPARDQLTHELRQKPGILPDPYEDL